MRRNRLPKREQHGIVGQPAQGEMEGDVSAIEGEPVPGSNAVAHLGDHLVELRKARRIFANCCGGLSEHQPFERDPHFGHLRLLPFTEFGDAGSSIRD